MNGVTFSLACVDGLWSGSASVGGVLIAEASGFSGAQKCLAMLMSLVVFGP